MAAFPESYIDCVHEQHCLGTPNSGRSYAPPGSRKPILPAQPDVTLGQFGIGRTRAATRRPMSPLRSTASNRRLIDMA
jgi:hypothetical protein